MNVDIEIAILASDSEIESFKLKTKSFCQVTKRSNSKYYYCRTPRSRTIDIPIGRSLSDFLIEFLDYKDMLVHIESIVRIGIFFITNEIAFLNIKLSKFELSLLTEFDCYLDISAYPCLDEQNDTIDI